jgi:hypothetical protein
MALSAAEIHWDSEDEENREDLLVILSITLSQMT